MNADKIRNLTEEELAHQERDLADQLFKLKFQLNMGQTESLKKIRGLRKEIVGEVVSSRMHKTIVVKVTRKKAHPFYKRVVARNKKFYAHDETNQAHVGDVVRLEETRPLSKLKRWKLKDIVRKAAIVPEAAVEVAVK